MVLHNAKLLDITQPNYWKHKHRTPWTGYSPEKLRLRATGYQRETELNDSAPPDLYTFREALPSRAITVPEEDESAVRRRGARVGGGLDDGGGHGDGAGDGCRRGREAARGGGRSGRGVEEEVPSRGRRRRAAAARERRGRRSHHPPAGLLPS